MYDWNGIRKLTLEEMEHFHNTTGLTGFFYLHNDNTESMIEPGYKWEDIKKHYENGGEFGIEKNVLKDNPELLSYLHTNPIPEFSGYLQTTLPPHRYYNPKFSLDGTGESLYHEVRSGYVEDLTALSWIEEVLRLEGKNLEADIVGYYKAEQQEETSLYSVNRMKIDFLDARESGHSTGGGLDDVTIYEDANRRTTLSVIYEPHNDSVTIVVNEYTSQETGIGAAAIPLDRFLQYSRDDFDLMVGEISIHNMEYTPLEDEIEY